MLLTLGRSIYLAVTLLLAILLSLAPRHTASSAQPLSLPHQIPRSSLPPFAAPGFSCNSLNTTEERTRASYLIFFECRDVNDGLARL